MPVLSVAQIAEVCGVPFEGPSEREISGANNLQDATENEMAFAENQKAMQTALSSKAGCLLVPANFSGQGDWAIIRVQNPRLAFAKVLGVLFPPRRPEPGIHPSAIVSPSALVGRGTSIGAYVTVGDNTRIGERCVVGAGCRIGADVSIGDDTILYPNVVLYDAVQLGSRVILHAGCVIGADGFGFVFVGDHYEKFPQVGTVEIADDVEIGVNACVDRAALGVTKIGRGTKLDNLVHVAHNCTLGQHVVVAAQTGFSGSVTVGDYAALGGQVGVADKAVIDAKAIVGAKSGIVTSQHISADEPVWGIPARPIKQHLRGLAHVGKLPHTLEELRELKQRVSRLELRDSESVS